jgi:DNA helicase IV
MTRLDAQRAAVFEVLLDAGMFVEHVRPAGHPFRRYSYIGRIGLFDEENEYEPVLLDWRAPAA